MLYCQLLKKTTSGVLIHIFSVTKISSKVDSTLRIFISQANLSKPQTLSLQTTRKIKKRKSQNQRAKLKHQRRFQEKRSSKLRTSQLEMTSRKKQIKKSQK